jgi:hypothetical protein
LLGDAGEYGDPVGVKNIEDNGVDGNINCGVLGGANAETDKGKDGTAEKVGESVSGDRACVSNAVNAETKEHKLFSPPLFVGSLDLLIVMLSSSSVQ